MHELGADIVAINIGNLNNEPYEHQRVDLSRKGALDFLPSKSFDGLHNSMFISSPHLEKMIEGTFLIDKERVRNKKRQIVSELKSQIKRVLKETDKVIKLDFDGFYL